MASFWLCTKIVGMPLVVRNGSTRGIQQFEAINPWGVMWLGILQARIAKPGNHLYTNQSLQFPYR